MIEQEQVVQLIASFFVAVFGLLLFRIASGHWFCRYGRESLFCAAAYLLSSSVIRVLLTFEVITANTARVSTGLIALGFTAIIIQIILLHQALHAQDEEKEHIE